MKLYLHYANLQQLKENFDDLFETKSEEEIKSFLKVLEYQDQQVSFQYLTQLETMKVLKDPQYFGSTIKAHLYWFYFWNDTCEHLIPTLKEFQDFEYYISEILNKGPQSTRKKTLSLVTPDVWNYWVKRLKVLFDYLEEKKYTTEVIVNDLWVLNLINTKYTKLKPILWRLLNKFQRNPIIDKNPDPQVPWSLGKGVYEKIKSFQSLYYNSIPTELKEFIMSYKKYNIERFWVDWVWFGLQENTNESLDIYFPYSSVAHWRNCATRWIQEKTGEYYVQDITCARYCQKYDIFLWQGTHERWITQRWNWVWKKYWELTKINRDILENENTRLVYQPFIPV